MINREEANQWFRRNKDSLYTKARGQDKVYSFFKDNTDLVSEKNVLEVGCCNAYRLAWLKEDFSSNCMGFDLSDEAIASGMKDFPNLNPKNFVSVQDTASFWLDENGFSSTYEKGTLDVIVFGFCLYLIDPDLLPVIVARTHQALRPGGVVVIYDFHSDPQRRSYDHMKGQDVYSYKMNYSKIFSWHPCYKPIYTGIFSHDGKSAVGNPDTDCAIHVLQRIPEQEAYPVLSEL